jgi:hypothetical protein
MAVNKNLHNNTFSDSSQGIGKGKEFQEFNDFLKDVAADQTKMRIIDDFDGTLRNLIMGRQSEDVFF